MLTHRQLRYFVDIVDAGSFSLAAERLFIAQSALSRQVKEMEQTLGVTLLEHGTRHLQMTPAGRSLYDDARRILAALQQAAVNARHAQRGVEGTVRLLQWALGLFAVGYALYALSGIRPARPFTPRAALPFGPVGGAFSALFGSGGFLYAIYLAGRLPDKGAIRVTQSTLIGLSTLTRAVLFLLAGMYAQPGVLALAALLVPSMLVGTAVGRRITLRLSREQFLRVVSAVVLCSGALLLWRLWAR